MYRTLFKESFNPLLTHGGCLQTSVAGTGFMSGDGVLPDVSLNADKIIPSVAPSLDREMGMRGNVACETIPITPFCISVPSCLKESHIFFS